ncbi:MAG: TRAP transporter large permease subunit [Thermodesulfobacteriota bacterium]|jgi:hypothetical protein
MPEAGIDPIWYATIVIVSVEIGLITPPVGMNLYAAKGVAEQDVKLEDIISGIIFFDHGIREPNLFPLLSHFEHLSPQFCGLTLGENGAVSGREPRRNEGR